MFRKLTIAGAVLISLASMGGCTINNEKHTTSSPKERPPDMILNDLGFDKVVKIAKHFVEKPNPQSYEKDKERNTFTG